MISSDEDSEDGSDESLELSEVDEDFDSVGLSRHYSTYHDGKFEAILVLILCLTFPLCRNFLSRQHSLCDL